MHNTPAYPINPVVVLENTDYSKNLFRLTSGMGGSELMKVDNLLCSGINSAQASDCLVLNSTMTDALATKPEIDTVNRMQGMYGQPCEQVNVDVNGVNFTPFNRITYGGKQYFNASCNINWRDNKTKLQLQTLPI